jgi:hypothetical protein
MSDICGATDSMDGPECTLLVGHPGWHQEWRDGQLWAEWRVDARPEGERAPRDDRTRWAAFTDDELNALQHGVRDLRDTGYAPDLTDGLAVEIHAEFRRRSGADGAGTV